MLGCDSMCYLSFYLSVLGHFDGEVNVFVHEFALAEKI